MSKEPSHLGRPRSERARAAVLEAVDDLLMEVGYSTLTMKGIAERAKVGRQTVYRWWGTKAEILFEATVSDAEDDLVVDPSGDLQADLVAYLTRLVTFLTTSPAGAAYRALLGESQHDPAVAALLASKDVLGDSARVVVGPAVGGQDSRAVELATARLVGPVFFWIVSGRDPSHLDLADAAAAFLRDLRDTGVLAGSG